MSTPVQIPEGAEEAATLAAQTDEPRLPAVRRFSAAQSPVPPKRRGRIWWWGAGIVLTGALGLVYFLQPWMVAPTPVIVEIAEFAPVTRVLAVNGRIAALHSVDVRALVSGPLAEVLVAEGDAVQSGAELARIDAAAQQAILRQAVAGLDAAAVAQEQAAATFARTGALGANVARTVLDDAATAVQTAAQEVARMTALVDQAQIQLGHFTIRAPMTGTVLTMNVDAGASIDPSTVLLIIADLTLLVVETDVDEAYATQIRPDQPTVLQLAGDPVARDGRVTLVAQRVDAATGGLAVQLAFNEAVTAPVGLTVTANIIVDQQDAALTAPRAAIQTVDDSTAVFVLTDGIATRRPVSVIDWPAARLIVTEGLAPGDVLIGDITGITEGQAVRAAEP